MDKERFLQTYKLSEEDLKDANISWQELMETKAAYEKIEKDLHDIGKEFIDEYLYEIDIAGIHSYRYRTKTAEHLLEKIIRKRKEKPEKFAGLDHTNYYKYMTDLIGIRVLFLYREDWVHFHSYLTSCFENNPELYLVDRLRDFDEDPAHYYIAEKPKAYKRTGDTKIYDENEIEIITGGIYRSLHYIIKYKGYYVGNKVRVVDMFTKKQKFLPPEEWVMFKDETGEIVPAIVSEELWDKANVILRRRSEDVKARQGICNHANLLTGKLFCMDCGTAYYRRESKDRSGNKNSKWICSGKIKGGSDSCASFAIYEEEIKPVLFEVFRDTKANADALVEEYLRDYAEMTDNGKLPKRIKELEKKIDFALQKKAKLLEFNVAGKITDRDFFEMTEQCNNEIKETEELIRELSETLESSEEFKKHINAVRSAIAAAQSDARCGIISKEFVDTYIDKIYVTPVDENTMKLSIKIFSGESTEKYLEKFRRHVGQMKSVSDSHTKNQGISTVSGSENSAGQTSKNDCPVRTMKFTREYRWLDGHSKEITYEVALAV